MNKHVKFLNGCLSRMIALSWVTAVAAASEPLPPSVPSPAAGRAVEARQNVLQAARSVIARVTGGKATQLRLDMIPAENGCDVYEYSAAGGMLAVRGSSAVALCRGFYDYMRACGFGQVSWAGSWLRVPETWPDAAATRRVTPFEIRHAYNVVTAGYTFPYWTWKRWEQELDWQAVHGFNLLMAPIATEAIMERVWLKIGLTQAEIDANTCGPAHQPWYRMGNICGIDGPLPKAWHAGQIALQHKILARMRELGIEPVVQSFAGFVPRSFKRIHPETKLLDTCWIGSLPKLNRPVMMFPDDPMFAVLTKAYMTEWEKEFGPAKYFLVDSFNEMEVPKTGRPETELLAEYGEKTWQAIRGGDPDAVWAIQGWTFGYQNWKPENLQALFSKVPDDRMLVLDYANDYSVIWKKYQAFWGKTWAVGYVPNMGGKTAYTGNLSFYATHSADVLADPAKGSLKGFTISGEGLENNELLYELLADMAWSRAPIDLDAWIVRYCRNRYGECPEAVANAWNILRKGCYAGLSPHPGYKWQHFGGLDRNPNFFEAASLFLSAADRLRSSPAYRADAVEFTALALSLKADQWYELALKAFAENDAPVFARAKARTLELLTQIDRLMEAHPYHRLERWIAFARAHSADPQLQDVYEANARCIVTYWTAGVQNYSCRVWGGLVRDYYREWLVREFDSMENGTPFDRDAFMIAYTKRRGVSAFTPCADPVAAAKAWLAAALAETLPSVRNPLQEGASELIGEWNPGGIKGDWTTVELSIPSDKLADIRAVVFRYSRGDHRLEIRSVELVADGRVVARDAHFGYAGIPDSRNVYRLAVHAGTAANNRCVIRASVKGGGGTDSRGAVHLIRDKP